MVAYGYLILQFYEIQTSSGLCREQKCMWCTYTQAGRTLVLTKINKCFFKEEMEPTNCSTDDEQIKEKHGTNKQWDTLHR